MRALWAVREHDQISSLIVIPKIREIFKAMGNVIVVFDNGDKKTIETIDAKGTMEKIVNAVETYYGGKQNDCT